MTAIRSEPPALKPASTGDPFRHLESAADVLTTTAPPGSRTLFFALTLFEPDPFWRADLDAFPVLRYQEQEAIPPEGTPDDPFVFAINTSRNGDAQLLVATDYLVSTLRRQEVAEGVRQHETPASSLLGASQHLDRLSRAESLALARAVQLGLRDEVAAVLSRWAVGVQVSVARSWLDRLAFASRVPFYARAYNSLPVIREAIDRMVSATVGVGPRAAGPSEEVRAFVEAATTDARMTTFVAHALRDAFLFGAGALVTDVRFGLPLMRLVRPDRLELLEGGQGTAVREYHHDGSSEVVEALVLSGVSQPGGPYPASTLEPWCLTLHAAMSLTASADDMEAKLPPIGERSPAAQALAQTVEISRLLGQEAATSLGELMRPLHAELPGPRYPLYLRGHESWP
jgi:hypothetical protein